MRNNTLSLLSGRVKKTPSTSADSNRYSYLDLKNAEPDTGVPSAHSSQRGLFGSDTSGNRQWFYADAGLSVDTGTGQITVNEDTVFIDTSGFTNSTSDNLADVLFDLDQNLQELGDNTLSTVATDNTINGAGTVGSPLSIGQQVFFTGKPEFAGLAIEPNISVISGISLADPIVITTTGSHNLTDGELVTIEDVQGTTELNGNNYYVDVLTTSTFALYSDNALTTTIDGTSGFTAYTSSGKILHGGYRFPEADGTAGTYLKTKGYGLLEFDRPIQYGGSQPTNPDLGDMWYDSVTTGDLLIWDGSNFASATGGGSQGAFTLRQFVGDGSTTAFDTQNSSVNKVLVFLNGILMRLTDDFTYSAGVVTFTQAPQSSDTIEVLMTGNASFVGLDLLGIENHDLIAVDGSGNVTIIGDLDMDGNGIINLVDPTNAQDAATKAYVDAQIGGASLETAGDTGTGTIYLDSQSLTISGTANEIETTASGQTVTIGLPTSITVDVTGDLTGNADTATALATSRDFSLTGAVTASAVGFDGTGNVALSTSITNLPNSSLANSSIDITDGTTTETISLGDTITFADGTDIDVVVSATGTLTVNHNVTGANSTITAATNTFVDEIAVTAQGHVTSVGTSAIDFDVADNYAYQSFTDGTNTTTADSNADTLTVTPGDQIEATISTDTLTLGHADSGVTAGSYGSSTAIPVLTIDAQGHVTAASTSSISTTWTITDGVTTQDIDGGDTLTVVDGTDINAVISATDTLTINNTSTLDSVTGRGNTTTNDISVGNITTSGYLRGPANFTIDPATHGDNTGTVIIAGNLTVSGTTTTVNSNTVEIGDNTLLLNSDETGAPSQDAGIEIERGTSTNVALRWSESNIHWEQTSDGTNYYRLLSTDDNYIEDLTAGTGIGITHTPGAASNATISTSNVPNSSLQNSSISISDGSTTEVVDLGETITFVDGTDMNVVVSATNQVTVNHNVTGANTVISAASNTFIDEISVTSQGHVTNVGTGTIDWNVADNHAFKTITDGSNDAVADSNGDTFTVTGTGDITATINPTNDTLTLSFNNSTGYITSESDTLDSVTIRGNTTNNDVFTGTVNTDLVQGRTYSSSSLNFDYDTTINGTNTTKLQSVSGIQLLFDTNNNDTNGLMIGSGTADPDTATIHMVVDNNGNVGIGTTTPSYSVDIIRSGWAELLLGSTGGTGAQIILDGNSNGDGDGSDYAQIVHDGTTGDLITKNLESGNIRFQSNSSTERLTILDAGNVGVSTSAPAQRLHVHHNTNATSTILSENSNSGTGARANIRMLSDSATFDLYATSSTYNGVASWTDAGVMSTASNASGGLILNAQQGGIKFQSGTTEAMRVEHSTGNVGIGTNAPSDILDVYKSQNASTNFYFRNPTSGTTSRSRIIANSDTGAGNVSMGMHSSTHSSYPNQAWLWASGTSTPLVLGTQGTPRMTISTAGNVGIGTNSPWEKLTVYGGGIDFGTAPNTNNAGKLSYNTTSGLMDIKAYSTGGNTSIALTTSNAGTPTEVVRITSAGDVGIGNNAPTEKLEVVGNVKAENIISEANGNAAGIYTFSKTVLANDGVNAAGDYTKDIFSVDNEHGAQVMTVMFNCSTSGYSVAKHYTVVHQFGGAPVDNLTANTGPYSGNDFSVSFTNATGIASGSKLLCTVENLSTSVNANITVTVFLGGATTAVTVAAL